MYVNVFCGPIYSDNFIALHINPPNLYDLKKLFRIDLWTLFFKNHINVEYFTQEYTFYPYYFWSIQMPFQNQGSIFSFTHHVILHVYSTSINLNY